MKSDRFFPSLAAALSMTARWFRFALRLIVTSRPVVVLAAAMGLLLYTHLMYESVWTSSTRRITIMVGINARTGPAKSECSCSGCDEIVAAGASLPYIVVDAGRDFFSLGLSERRTGQRLVKIVEDEHFGRLPG